MDMTTTPQKIVEQNEFQINLLKTFEFTSYVMECHVCEDRWTAVKGEMLKTIVEPKNKEEKFAAAIMKNDCLFGHLPKITNWKIF